MCKHYCMYFLSADICFHADESSLKLVNACLKTRFPSNFRDACLYAFFCYGLGTENKNAYLFMQLVYLVICQKFDICLSMDTH